MSDNAIVIQGRPVSSDDRGGGLQMQRVIEGDSVVASVYVVPVNAIGTFLAAGSVDTRRQMGMFNAGAVDMEMAPAAFTFGQGFPFPAGASFATNYSGTIFFKTQAGTADLRAWAEA